MLSLPDFEEKTVIFALLSRDDKLSFKNDNVIIKNDGVIKHQSSCYRLFALFIVGHATITTGLLQRAKKFGFSIVLLNHNLNVYASWNTRTEGNTLLRKKQYFYSELDIAHLLVRNKIAQQIAALERIREKSLELKEAIKQLKTYQDRVFNEPPELKELLGLEGIASKVYFTQMFSDFNWSGRKPRVKHDITNCLLDNGYTLLFNLIEALLNVYGFDTYKGFYHQEFYQRKSLVCDLVEPFRPIVDYRIRKAYNLGQIKEEDFYVHQKQYRLKIPSSPNYSNWILQELLSHKQEIFLYIQSFYRAFMRSKPISEYPFFELQPC
jgi:CRISPR-associated protein Cas1